MIDYHPKIEIHAIPPLCLGGEFLPNADYEQDAQDLGILYGIRDTRILCRGLFISSVAAIFCPRDFALCLASDRPDVDRALISKFVKDCRRAVWAQAELWY